MKDALTSIALCGIFLLWAYVIFSLLKWLFIKLMGERL